MKIIKTKSAPEAIGTYSQGVKVENYIFTSGQIGLNPETGKLVQGGIELEIYQIFKNLEGILLEGGSSTNKIIKLNIYLIDLNNFSILNEILKDTLNEDKLPARSTVQVSKLPANANIEIDAIAEL